MIGAPSAGAATSDEVQDELIDDEALQNGSLQNGAAEALALVASLKPGVDLADIDDNALMDMLE